MTGKSVKFVKINIFNRIINFTQLLLLQLIKLQVVILYLLIYKLFKFSQILTVNIFKYQAQIKLSIGRCSQFFGVNLIEGVDNTVVEAKYQGGVRCHRLGRIVNNYDARQVGKPL